MFCEMIPTPSLASPSGIAPIISYDESVVTAMYAKGTVRSMVTTTITLAYLIALFAECVKYL